MISEKNEYRGKWKTYHFVLIIFINILNRRSDEVVGKLALESTWQRQAGLKHRIGLADNGGTAAATG